MKRKPCPVRLKTKASGRAVCSISFYDLTLSLFCNYIKLRHRSVVAPESFGLGNEAEVTRFYHAGKSNCFFGCVGFESFFAYRLAPIGRVVAEVNFAVLYPTGVHVDSRNVYELCNVVHLAHVNNHLVRVGHFFGLVLRVPYCARISVYCVGCAFVCRALFAAET